MSTDKSKTVVYENGDFQNIQAVKEVLKAYWRLNECERKAFRITMSNHIEPPEEFLDQETQNP